MLRTLWTARALANPRLARSLSSLPIHDTVHVRHVQLVRPPVTREALLRRIKWTSLFILPWFFIDVQFGEDEENADPEGGSEEGKATPKGAASARLSGRGKEGATNQPSLPTTSSGKNYKEGE